MVKVYILAAVKVVYIVSAIMSLPVYIPILLDAIAEVLVVKKLFKDHRRKKVNLDLEDE